MYQQIQLNIKFNFDFGTKSLSCCIVPNLRFPDSEVYLGMHLAIGIAVPVAMLIIQPQ